MGDRRNLLPRRGPRDTHLSGDPEASASPSQSGHRRKPDVRLRRRVGTIATVRTRSITTGSCTRRRQRTGSATPLRRRCSRGRSSPCDAKGSASRCWIMRPAEFDESATTRGVNVHEARSPSTGSTYRRWPCSAADSRGLAPTRWQRPNEGWAGDHGPKHPSRPGSGWGQCHVAACCRSSTAARRFSSRRDRVGMRRGSTAVNGQVARAYRGAGAVLRSERR